jgi:hypothetical protein
MSPDVQILLSGALTFGVPLLVAVRELVVLGRGDVSPPPAGDAHPTELLPNPPDDDAALPPLPPSFAHLTRIDPAGVRRAEGRVLEEA